MSRRRILTAGYLPELHFTFYGYTTWSYDLPSGYNKISYQLYTSDMHSYVTIEYKDEIINQGRFMNTTSTISASGGLLEIYTSSGGSFSGEITIWS